MALLNAVVLTSKTIKGGRNKVRIAVAHNAETRYIVTDIILDSNKEFKNGVVVKRPDAAILNTKIRNLLQRYQSALDELPYINGLSCPELVFLLRNGGNNRHRTLQSIYDEYMANALIKPSTAICYKHIWRNIARYFGEDRLIEHIIHSTILGYDKHLRDRKLKPASIRINLIFLRVLLNYASRCGYVQFKRDPFFGYKFPEQEIRQSWLTVDEIKKIRDHKCTKSNIAKCRDLFMLSYYLGGINIVDLLDINFNKHTDTLQYIRKKTDNKPNMNRFVEFKIPEEAKIIISQLKGSDGFLNVSKYQRKTHCHYFFDRNIHILAAQTGLEQLVYYSARKSFAQHAFDLGVNTNIIDYILGHKADKGGTALYAYIKVTPDMATKTIRLVLDNLK